MAGEELSPWQPTAPAPVGVSMFNAKSVGNHDGTPSRRVSLCRACDGNSPRFGLAPPTSSGTPCISCGGALLTREVLGRPIWPGPRPGACLFRCWSQPGRAAAMVKFLKVRAGPARPWVAGQAQPSWAPGRPRPGCTAQPGLPGERACGMTDQCNPNNEYLQPGKVVILLTGRHAGKKAVIVKNYDDGASGRAYGHALVLGLSKAPRKVRVKRGAGRPGCAACTRAELGSGDGGVGGTLHPPSPAERGGQAPSAATVSCAWTLAADRLAWDERQSTGHRHPGPIPERWTGRWRDRLLARVARGMPAHVLACQPRCFACLHPPPTELLAPRPGLHLPSTPLHPRRR